MADKRKVVDISTRRRPETIIHLIDPTETRTVELWDAFRDKAHEAYEWRDPETIDDCVRLLRELRETAEVNPDGQT